ncbi:UNVERIFIED_CONTAM: hypothetical protein Sangu_0186300 [Sesamum angustifolium]|uniref:Uncharacterized protein n=1 Tax=Sesamum angustifolium TaxID=2727405 RepID=A0AAW2RMF3_9LAMI
MDPSFSGRLGSFQLRESLSARISSLKGCPPAFLGGPQIHAFAGPRVPTQAYQCTSSSPLGDLLVGKGAPAFSSRGSPIARVSAH